MAAIQPLPAQACSPLDFLWFLPSGGDARYLASPIGERAPTPAYLREVAVAADRLGFYGVLLPTGIGCADAWITAALDQPLLHPVGDRLGRPHSSSRSIYPRERRTGRMDFFRPA